MRRGPRTPRGHEPLPREGDVGLVGAQLLAVEPLGQAAQLPGLAQADADHRLAVHGGQTPCRSRTRRRHRCRRAAPGAARESRR